MGTLEYHVFNREKLQKIIAKSRLLLDQEENQDKLMKNFLIRSLRDETDAAQETARLHKDSEKKELENLKFQLQMQMKSKPSKPLAVLNTQITTTKSRLAPVQPITIVPDNTNANQCNIPDDLFTPHGSFILKTPAELKMINTFDFPQIACEPLPKTERIESFSDILYQL